ncbi:MAG TPA: hypothetical protein P5246_08160 [Candidatus Omnitrophota bacterium]|jgi:hypothetical protein|nr:hypothetical protein [Candidatus Omnitrophota bacterium]HSA32026.1 hypothetical protein [Candidatus Omnitrophota bacterium]
MNYKIDITFKADHLFVQVSGEDSYETTLDIVKRIVAACEQYHCYNVLGVSDMKNPLDTMDAYEFQTIFKEAGVTFKHRFAWAQLNPEAREVLKFAETVLKNRGMLNGRLFADPDEAKKWLLAGGQEGDPAN